MNECFPCNTVEQTPRKCGCGGDARPGQRNCLSCHAGAQRIYRARQANKRKSERASYLRLIAESDKAARTMGETE